MKQGKKERGVNKGDSKRGFQRGIGGIGGENPIGETKALTLSRRNNYRAYYSILGLPLSDSDSLDRMDVFQLMHAIEIRYAKRKVDMMNRVGTSKMYLITFDGFRCDSELVAHTHSKDNMTLRVGSWEELEELSRFPSVKFLLRFTNISREFFDFAKKYPRVPLQITFNTIDYIKQVGGTIMPDEARQAIAKENMRAWESAHPDQVNHVREVYEHTQKETDA